MLLIRRVISKPSITAICHTLHFGDILHNNSLNLCCRYVTGLTCFTSHFLPPSPPPLPSENSIGLAVSSATSFHLAGAGLQTPAPSMSKQCNYSRIWVPTYLDANWCQSQSRNLFHRYIALNLFDPSLNLVIKAFDLFNFGWTLTLRWLLARNKITSVDS